MSGQNLFYKLTYILPNYGGPQYVKVREGEDNPSWPGWRAEPITEEEYGRVMDQQAIAMQSTRRWLLDNDPEYAAVDHLMGPYVDD